MTGPTTSGLVSVESFHTKMAESCSVVVRWCLERGFGEHIVLSLLQRQDFTTILDLRNFNYQKFLCYTPRGQKSGRLSDRIVGLHNSEIEILNGRLCQIAENGIQGSKSLHRHQRRKLL